MIPALVVILLLTVFVATDAASASPTGSSRSGDDR
jgi:hypothetical protein